MIYYAGIGNRKITVQAYDIIKSYAKYLNEQGYILRSGGAKGADTAFEEGSCTNCEIFYHRDATDEAIKLASKFHPAWDRCNEIARRLLGRNAMILLGKDLKTPVKFVICYTVNESSGGTSLGIRIAKAYEIPVINLAKV